MESVLRRIARSTKSLTSWYRSNYWVVLTYISLVLVAAGCWYSAHSPRHHPPVGTYVAIMGGVAALVTFRREPQLAEKAGWILVITVLMFAEIRNLYVDQEEHSEQQTFISRNFSAQGETLAGIARNIQLSSRPSQSSGTAITVPDRNVKRPRKTTVEATPTVVNIAPSYGNLRERAIQLSQELYGLISGEQQDVQTILAAGPADATRREAAVHLMSARLSRDYFLSYDGQVRQIRDDFAKFNLRDHDIEDMMRTIDRANEMEARMGKSADWKVNSAMVMMLARGLTNLASMLPQT